MIHTINILTNTKSGDAYDKVAINKYPIIYIDTEDVDGILDDPELIDTLKRFVKNKTTYEVATIVIRTIDEGSYNIQDNEYKLNEKVSMDWE